MNVGLLELFPNANMGLSQIGFFFGAGTSYAANYPLTSELTSSVLKKLTPPEIELIEKILATEGLVLNVMKGEPDIEVLSDIINKARITGAYTGIDLLIQVIRKHIVDVINDVITPNLEYHIQFFEGLKRRLSYKKECVWIFTTNYDLVLEVAASIVKIPIYNAFEGIAQRFFDIERMDLTYGKINSSRIFESVNEPHIKLVKLHGSISWYKNTNNDIIECFSPNLYDNRCMILPRRTKVTETLEAPYDKLFRYAYAIIGRQCKYIVTSGYSFRDEHINDIIFTPKLRENSLRVFALAKDETPEIIRLSSFTGFNYLVNGQINYNGIVESSTSDLWDFRKFSNLF